MFSSPENFYAGWRAPHVAPSALRDENAVPTERLLQIIWQHQRLRRDRLQTAGGRVVRIIHPGFISVEGGPDFRGAIIQVGDDPPCSGDVEIDLRSAGWRVHGHDRNPSFKSVILHVVWDAAGAPDPAGSNPPVPDGRKPVVQPCPPTLPLRDRLDAPLHQLGQALENEPLRSLPENLRGKCCAPLRELSEPRLAGLLRAAARVRFENKAEAMLARARNSSWEQAWWENLFRALGYKHNAWPMLNLAETRPRWEHGVNSVFLLQTRLLGISGLLPGELTRSQKNSDSFLRRMWDAWWREREEFAGCRLPRAAWKFHGLRPVNHPQRRLALAAHWLSDEKFLPEIRRWGAAELPDRKLPASLHEIFHVQNDEYWSWHWTFNSARLPGPLPLLGTARMTDLAVNVVLPWLWVRAREGGNDGFRREVERRFLAWPAAEDNAVLKLARQRLLGSSNTRILKTAALQQGLMQIVRDFCEHSDAVCAACRFPGLVRGWSGDSAVQFE